MVGRWFVPTTSRVSTILAADTPAGTITEVPMGQSESNKTSGSEASDKEVEKDPPGPRDHGRDGGMATRENAPEAVQRSEGGDSTDG
ncbi:hypothetical protein GTC6_04525 [Gordonia terrae C-6]|uniref:Uncharacterized protein n=2 Tax=Gordoniaceae TaxID=85026 RepID=R7YDX2_9ACTN|nr:hypothetical protein GTC6_04525 [Gordonia terrae C-6]